MESLQAPLNFMEHLLDFASDIGEEEHDDDAKTTKALTVTLRFPLRLPSSDVKTLGIVEEELEWISNKDAFPMVESLVDIIPNHPSSISSNSQSPVSVLENTSSSNSTTSSQAKQNKKRLTGISEILRISSSVKVPVRARSKKIKRRRLLFNGQQWQCWVKDQTQKRSTKQRATKANSTVGRKCLHCQSEKTPQWRAGPMGPKTLCNACGVRYKSGRLLPEYRPASCPSFSTQLHSNSHRKILEMRRKQMNSQE